MRHCQNTTLTWYADHSLANMALIPPSGTVPIFDVYLAPKQWVTLAG